MQEEISSNDVGAVPADLGPECLFCGQQCAGTCNPELPTRVAVLQMIGGNILREVEKIGYDRLKKEYPELLKAIDSLNIASGHNLAKTFLERYRLADAVAEKAIKGAPDTQQAMIAYHDHRKHNPHSTW